MKFYHFVSISTHCDQKSSVFLFEKVFKKKTNISLSWVLFFPTHFYRISLTFCVMGAFIIHTVENKNMNACIPHVVGAFITHTLKN